MLRLNLGDLLTWQGDEYVVAAARSQAVMLQRLSDNDIVWVDVPTMADELILTDPAEVPDASDGVPYAAQVGDAELEKARWWVQHLNEVAHGAPDPDDPDAVPRPGYGAGTSKQDRQELKVRELTAAGHRVSIRSLQRKQRAFDAHGVHGLVDRRALRSGAAPQVDDRILEVVLAVLAATRSDSTVTAQCGARLPPDHGRGPDPARLAGNRQPVLRHRRSRAWPCLTFVETGHPRRRYPVTSGR